MTLLYRVWSTSRWGWGQTLNTIETVRNPLKQINGRLISVNIESFPNYPNLSTIGVLWPLYVHQDQMLQNMWNILSAHWLLGFDSISSVIEMDLSVLSVIFAFSTMIFQPTYLRRNDLVKILTLNAFSLSGSLQNPSRVSSFPSSSSSSSSSSLFPFEDVSSVIMESSLECSDLPGLWMRQNINANECIFVPESSRHMFH